MAEPGKRMPPWAWVAIGCGGGLLLLVIAVGALGVIGWRHASRMQADMADPAARESRVREVLGARELPEGYHPMLALDVPLVIEMAILTDRAPGAGGETEGWDERAFLYLNTLDATRDRDELRGFFEGRTDDPSVLARNRIRIERGQPIARGALDLPGQRVLYYAQRGTAQVRQAPVQGVQTVLLVECPHGPSRLRLGLWFAPDPTPSEPVSEVDWSGTPADPEAISAFVGHFRLCPAPEGS